MRISFYALIHLFLSFSHPSVSSPARPLPSIIHRTTLQSITITSRKEEKEEPKRIWPESPFTSSSTSPPPAVSSALSPTPQPSLLATLLARKRSTVTVPATKEVSPPLRGSSHPSPDRLPYLPHSPFHLFSYDLDEGPSPPAPTKPSEDPPKTTSPRSEGQQNSTAQALALCLFFPFPLSSSCTSLSFFHLFWFLSPSLFTSLTARLLTFYHGSRYHIWFLHVSVSSVTASMLFLAWLKISLCLPVLQSLSCCFVPLSTWIFLASF